MSRSLVKQMHVGPLYLGWGTREKTVKRRADRRKRAAARRILRLIEYLDRNDFESSDLISRETATWARANRDGLADVPAAS